MWGFFSCKKDVTNVFIKLPSSARLGLDSKICCQKIMWQQIKSRKIDFLYYSHLLTAYTGNPRMSCSSMHHIWLTDEAFRIKANKNENTHWSTLKCINHPVCPLLTLGAVVKQKKNSNCYIFFFESCKQLFWVHIKKSGSRCSFTFSVLRKNTSPD